MPNKPEVGKSQESNLSKEKVKKSWDQQQDGKFDRFADEFSKKFGEKGKNVKLPGGIDAVATLHHGKNESFGAYTEFKLTYKEKLPGLVGSTTTTVFRRYSVGAWEMINANSKDSKMYNHWVQRNNSNAGPDEELRKTQISQIVQNCAMILVK